LQSFLAKDVLAYSKKQYNFLISSAFCLYMSMIIDVRLTDMAQHEILNSFRMFLTVGYSSKFQFQHLDKVQEIES
jgi:hypothetical protein